MSISLMLIATFAVTAAAEQQGWSKDAPRDEMHPKYAERIDAQGRLILSLTAVGRPDIDGAWVKYFPVHADQHYQFTTQRKTSQVASPRRSAIVKLTWLDADENLLSGPQDLHRPEYPTDGVTNDTGWTSLSDTYLAPPGASQAKIELRLRWTSGNAEFRDTQLLPVAAPEPRLVKLATVHFRPAGSSPRSNRESFAPLIATASDREADLVCLPESLTYYGTGQPLESCAEPIPGPSTDYLAQLSKVHDLYIAAGLTERDGSTLYNTCVLLGPDGELVGKYRKVCVPREEIEAGITPGTDYPVFDTRFGKVGLMVCWDVHFPEVARNLSIQGAEVIAMPIWGGMPTLAAARALENQIYLVTSTYSGIERQAMTSAIFTPSGKRLVENGREWGTVFVAEVDLNKQHHWRGLGNFKSRIPRERPVSGFAD